MAKQSQHRRLRRWMVRGAVATVLFNAIGCGFPHGRYGGDAMLGQFNRPIAATPPIWTGGNDPGVSPAWDGGARMGLPSPDVPAKSNPVLEKSFLLPTFSGSLGLNNMFRGGDSDRAGMAPGANPLKRPMPTSVGATLLPGTPVAVHQVAPVVAPVTVASVKPRLLDQHTLLTSGSSLEPTMPDTGRISQAVYVKDPRSVASVEEGQSILQTCGARSMSMEPQPTGEWRFICTVGDGPEARRYEAKSDVQIEALRAVMWQVKNER